MRLPVIIILALLIGDLFAQTKIDKSIPFKAGQQIQMNFDYPEIIRISTWDRNEIQIQGMVSINFGEQDDEFELIVSESGNIVKVENRIKNLKNLPQVITIHSRGGKKVFESKEAYRKYKDESNEPIETTSWGVNMEITLDIKVPANAVTSIESVYGMVEAKDFMGPLTVNAKYGGVDVALKEKLVGEISAETNYGQIYSNLNVNFDGDLHERDFHTIVSARLGSGPRYDLTSTYGNVYLRKSD